MKIESIREVKAHLNRIVGELRVDARERRDRFGGGRALAESCVLEALRRGGQGGGSQGLDLARRRDEERTDAETAQASVDPALDRVGGEGLLKRR
jgi:hypothetical protein